jgi:hypothetical protein
METTDKFDRVNPILLEKYRNQFAGLGSKKQKELLASIGTLFLTDGFKKKTREKIQKDMKVNDMLTLIFAFIGIICNIIASSIYITFHQIISNFNIIIHIIR